MSVSRESHGIDGPASDQESTLIDGVYEITPEQVAARYRARHAYLTDADAGLPNKPVDATEINEAVDEWGEPEDFRSIVRPYTWTQGRTRPVQDLAIETLVSTSDEGRSLTSLCSTEHAAIVELCTEIRSVAEVAALLALPLGVARVLLADVIDTGLVHVHRNSLGSLGWDRGPDLSLLERVLDGLYRL